jgi:predicted dehydrogenase
MKRVRYGMVGGGEGAFIGAVHRQAARLDDQLELVCGAFSSDAERSRRSGAALNLDESRCYPDYESMFRAEAVLAPDERMQFVAIVTPNHLHYPVAAGALANGFHVLSDKPATVSLDECRRLHDQLVETGLLYGLTHPYTSYPMVIEARQRIAAGELGQSGPSGCMADIGVHAFNIAENVAGVAVTELCAALDRTVEGRRLDDHGAAFLRFDNGAHGVLTASQVATGEENGLRLRVYGDRGGLEWCQMEPNSLWLRYSDRPAELVRTALPYTGATARAHSRLPAGHPEGYIEAFANLYRNFAEHVRLFNPAGKGMSRITSVPGIRAAMRGMAFIETVVASSDAGAQWVSMPDDV